MNKPRCFLIIDDEPSILSMVTSLLDQEFLSCEVKAVSDKDTFNRSLEEGAFDLVITDYYLGWTDGLQILNKVRQLHPDCPVIMFTGTGSEETAVEAMKSGLDDYVLKSADSLKRLSISVHSALDRSHERKLAEAKIKESLQWWKSIFEGSRDAIFITGTDSRFVDVNQAASALTGYSKEELLGMSIPDLHEDVDLHAYKMFFDRIMSGESIISEAPLLTKNGAKVSTEFSNKRIEINDVSYMHTVARNITERKQVESRMAAAYAGLQNSEERLKRAQMMAHIGNWEWDLQEGTLHWDEENYRMFGLPRETIPSAEGFLATVHPDDLEFVRRSMGDALKGKPYDLDFRIRRPDDGTERVVHANGEVAWDVEGQPILFFGTVQDITERKQAEDKIKASLKEKEILLREIHHRVKNNLQVICSLLRLQSAKIKDKQYVDMFRECRDRIKTMSFIHEQLYRTNDLVNIDFGKHVKSLVDGLFKSHGIDSNKVKLGLEIKNVSINLENAIPCGLIINELVSNTLKYAFPQEADGNILISLRSINEDEFELTVSDDGIGLPEDLDIHTTDTMGFELVRILVEEQLNGKIEVDRTEGTRFTITLKIAK